MSDGYFVTPRDAEQIEMLEGVHRRTMATTDEAMLCHFFLEAGCGVPRHNHMNDQVGYVVSGKVEVTINEQVRVIETGDSYAVPGGIFHSVKAVVDSVVIDVFSPPREDYRTEAK
jgi:quercetin dioxygenase-like cupin family protein